MNTSKRMNRNYQLPQCMEGRKKMENKRENYFITLPCKVGTEVWSAVPFIDDVPRKGYITAFLIDEKGVNSFYVKFDSVLINSSFFIHNMGKTIFFTLEEAEANLSKGVENG